MCTAEHVRLLWTVQREQGQAQTLVFVRTDAQVQLQKETLRWLSDSRVSVFGRNDQSCDLQSPIKARDHQR